MKKRLLSLLLVLVMLMGVMAGCSGKETPQATESPSVTNKPAADGGEETVEKTKITFMGWGTDAEIATFTAMIEQYEAAYPDVDVEYIPVADNEFDTKLQTMIGAGECPDVFYCNIDKMMKYAITGNLLDLTDYYANNEIFDQDDVW